MAIIKPNNNTISAITALPASISTGKVLQVVSAENTAERSTTSTSFSEVVSAQITPSATSSKVLVIGSLANVRRDSGTGFIQMRISDGASYHKKTAHAVMYNADNDAERQGSISGNFLHSANTTSQKTYTLQFASGNGGAVVVGDNGDTTSSITLMEIAGWL